MPLDDGGGAARADGSRVLADGAPDGRGAARAGHRLPGRGDEGRAAPLPLQRPDLQDVLQALGGGVDHQVNLILNDENNRRKKN